MRERPPLAAVIAVIASLTLGTGSAASLSVTSQDLTPYRTCLLTGTPSTTSTVADSFVVQTLPTTTNDTTILTVQTALNSNDRAYVRFDLASCSPHIPASATVRNATLRLFITTLPLSCRTYDVFAATASWAESTVTWNNQPFGTASNNPASSSASTTFQIGAVGGCTFSTSNAYMSATLTSDVQAQVSGSASNFGWMIRDGTEDAVVAATGSFAAKDAGTASQAPQLVVSYVEVP